MVSTRPLISKSSSPCTNPLLTVPGALITIGITVTFMFLSFSLLLQGLRTYLFAFLQFYPVVSRDGKVHHSAGSLFCFCWLSLGLVVWPKLYDLFIKNVIIIILLLVSFSPKNVTSALQDYSEKPSRSQYCYIDSFDSPSAFQIR